MSIGEHPQQRRRRTSAAARQEIVLTLKAAGSSVREIVGVLDGMGIHVTHETVNNDWKAALSRHYDYNDEAADALIKLQLYRLERIVMSAWRQAQAGSVEHMGIIMRAMAEQRKIIGLEKADHPYKYNWYERSATFTQRFANEDETNLLADQAYDELMRRLPNEHLEQIVQISERFGTVEYAPSDEGGGEGT